MPAQPPQQPAVYPRAIARVLFVVLAIEAVLIAAYGVFALVPRRGIFADLASAPTSVTREAATQSDTINLILLLTASVATLASIALTAIWVVRARRAQPPVPTRLGLPCWLLAGVGLAAVLVAFGLHTSTDPGQIAFGYVILGSGALLLAAAAVWVALVVRRAGRQVTVSPATPVAKPSA